MKTKFALIFALAVPFFFLSSPACFAQTPAGKIEMPIEIIKDVDTDGSFIYFLAQYMDSEAFKFGVGVIDVRNPLKPVKLGYAAFFSYTEVMRLVRIDKTIFVCGNPPEGKFADNKSLITSVDVSNPAKPIVLGSLALRDKVWDMRQKPGNGKTLVCLAEAENTSAIFEIDVSVPSGMKRVDSSFPEDYYYYYKSAGNFFAYTKNNSADVEHSDVRLALFDSAGKQLFPNPVKLPETIGWAFNDYLVSGTRIYGLIRGDGAVGYIAAIDAANPAAPRFLGLADMYQAFPDDAIYDAIVLNGYMYLYGTGTVDDKTVGLLRKIKATDFAASAITRVSQVVLPELPEESWITAILPGNNVIYVATSSSGIFVYKP